MVEVQIGTLADCIS